MDSRELTPEQRQWLRDHIAGHACDIRKLLNRMNARAWFTDDACKLNLEAALLNLRCALGHIRDLQENPDDRTVRRIEGGNAVE